jgi:multimeric flavodoxin WrbA
MKVIAINGSARKEGNTALLLQRVLDECAREGIETELFNLAGHKIHGCLACNQCWKNKDQRCARKDDVINTCLEKMVAADGILLGSPTYFTDVSTEMKALVDRCGFVAKANGDMFKRKVGAAVVAVRRAGSTHAFDTMNHLFTISQMIVPGSSYWNMGIGMAPGDVLKDEEGMNTMRVLGENMAWLIKKLAK